MCKGFCFFVVFFFTVDGSATLRLKMIPTEAMANILGVACNCQVMSPNTLMFDSENVVYFVGWKKYVHKYIFLHCQIETLSK